MANWSHTNSQGWGDISEGWEATINGTRFSIVVDARTGKGTLYRSAPGNAPIKVKDGLVEQLKRYAETLRASRPGAKDTMAVEERFYFGKGRKERFADDYEAASRRVQSTPELRRYAKILMQDEFDSPGHWRWVLTGSVREIVSWAREVESGF